jgi:hypothetical protein
MPTTKPTAHRPSRMILAAMLVAAGCAGAGSGEPPAGADATGAEPTPAERIALWRRQSPGEPLPAALTFRRPLSIRQTREFLERHDLRPFAVHLRIAGSSYAPRVPPEEASLALVERAREQALDLVLHTLCDPGGTEARLDRAPDPGRDSASQAALERAMLAQAERSRHSLAELRADAPIVYGVKALGAVAAVERLAAEPAVARVEPWMRMPIRGAVRVVGPEPAMGPGEPAAEAIPGIEAPGAAEVRARLRQGLREPPAECGAWAERQAEIRREGARTRGVPPPDTAATRPPAAR